MADEKRKSNRERMIDAEREKVSKIPTGDLIAEMLDIGSPKKAHVAARKADVSRFEMLQAELNKRLPVAETVEA